MKAAVFHEMGPPEVLRYEDVPDPACPKDGVLVDVEAISIEGGDTLHRARGPVAALPHVVGYQCAGTIREVGADVGDRQVGQRVVCVMMDGSHAEQVAVNAAATWPVPEGADLAKCACVPIAVGTADDCLFELGRLSEGETVLVHAAAGGVGMAAVQLASRAGATVIGTASSANKLSRLEAMGLSHGIVYTEEDFVARTLELTGGTGAHVVIDPVGGDNLARSIEAAAYRGRVLFVGSAGRDEGGIDPRLLQPGNKSLIGVFLGAELLANMARVHAMIAGHIADAASGKLEIVIDRTYPLSQAAEAHRYIESRKAVGRVVLLPRG